MCSLVSVFTLFYLILENMSTNVRKFRFPCYIWHFDPRRNDSRYLIHICLFVPPPPFPSRYLIQLCLFGTLPIVVTWFICLFGPPHSSLLDSYMFIWTPLLPFCIYQKVYISQRFIYYEIEVHKCVYIIHKINLLYGDNGTVVHVCSTYKKCNFLWYRNESTQVYDIWERIRLELPVWVRKCAFRWDDLPYTFSQPGWVHLWDFKVLQAGLGEGVGGEVGRGTASCLTRVKSVNILAIMNKDGLDPGADSVLRLRSSGAGLDVVQVLW